MLQPVGDLVRGMQVQSMGLTGPPQSAADLVIDGNIPIKPCPVAVFVHAVVDTSIVSGTAISVLIPVCGVVVHDVEKNSARCQHAIDSIEDDVILQRMAPVFLFGNT